MKYEEKIFDLKNLKGLSDRQVTEHLKLYAGYVKNVNALTDKVAELKMNSEGNALAISELTRRFGFEWNGMRLHELYFDSLDGASSPPSAGDNQLKKAIGSQYGSFENWQNYIKSKRLY